MHRPYSRTAVTTLLYQGGMSHQMQTCITYVDVQSGYGTASVPAFEPYTYVQGLHASSDIGRPDPLTRKHENIWHVPFARAQAIVPLATKARRAILLSGTPALSRPSELFTQLNLLSASTWASFRDFGKRQDIHFSMPLNIKYLNPGC